MLRLGEGHRFCVLGDFCAQIGWKHAAIVKELEGKREAAASEYWAKKKDANIKRAAAVAAANAQLGDLQGLIEATGY